jgi:hypothetical protein
MVLRLASSLVLTLTWQSRPASEPVLSVTSPNHEPRPMLNQGLAFDQQRARQTCRSNTQRQDCSRAQQHDCQDRAARLRHDTTARLQQETTARFQQSRVARLQQQNRSTIVAGYHVQSGGCSLGTISNTETVLLRSAQQRRWTTH